MWKILKYKKKAARIGGFSEFIGYKFNLTKLILFLYSSIEQLKL